MLSCTGCSLISCSSPCSLYLFPSIREKKRWWGGFPKREHSPCKGETPPEPGRVVGPRGCVEAGAEMTAWPHSPTKAMAGKEDRTVHPPPVLGYSEGFLNILSSVNLVPTSTCFSPGR